jgi:hypothetical protein
MLPVPGSRYARTNAWFMTDQTFLQRTLRSVAIVFRLRTKPVSAMTFECSLCGRPVDSEQTSASLSKENGAAGFNWPNTFRSVEVSGIPGKNQDSQKARNGPLRNASARSIMSFRDLSRTVNVTCTKRVPRTMKYATEGSSSTDLTFVNNEHEPMSHFKLSASIQWTYVPVPQPYWAAPHRFLWQYWPGIKDSRYCEGIHLHR